MVLDRLFSVIQSRRGGGSDTSYTEKAFTEGRSFIARKVGEEAVECLVAALTEEKTRTISESADLLYHLLILWEDVGIQPEEVWCELRNREGTSGLVEKANRKQ